MHFLAPTKESSTAPPNNRHKLVCFRPHGGDSGGSGSRPYLLLFISLALQFQSGRHPVVKVAQAVVWPPTLHRPSTVPQLRGLASQLERD